MTDFKVITSVEQLPFDKKRLGVVLMPASRAGAEPCASNDPLQPCFARPWTWSNITWKVWSCQNGVCTAVSAKPVGLPPEDSGRKALGAYAAKRLTSRYSQCDPDWLLERTVHLDQAKKKLPPWHAVIAEAAQSPYPIPYLLNIAALLELDAAADATFIAAPAFQVNGISYSPKDPELDASGFWKFGDANGGIAVEAYSEFNSLSVPANSSLKPTLWINPPDKSSSLLHSNWIGSATERLAPSFDLAGVILGAVAAAIDPKNADASANRAVIESSLLALRSLFVASLRDTADRGKLQRANKRTVVDDIKQILDDKKPPQAMDWKGLLDTPDPTPAPYDGDLGLAKWKLLLRRALGTNLAKSRALQISEVEAQKLAISPDAFDVTSARTVDQDLAELHQIHSLLTDDTVLSRVIVEQIRELKAPADDTALDTLADYLAQNVAVSISLVSKSRQANLNRFWACVTRKWRGKDPTAVDDLKKDVADVVTDYFHIRATTLAPTQCMLPGPLLPTANAEQRMLSTLSTLLTPYVTTAAAAYAETAFAKLGTFRPKKNAKDTVSSALLADVTEATPIPAPLIFRVMELATAGADTDPDPLRGMRGVGVLLRRVAQADKPQSAHGNQNPWYPLNIATLKDQSDVPLLVASRLGYDRDLRAGLIPYDNGPLPLSNLLQEYGKDRLIVTTTSESSLFTEPLFPLVHYEETTGEVEDTKFLHKTPMLRFGDVFDARFFALTNVGVLPREIADDQHPAKLSPAKLLSLPATPTQIPYARTVRVGHMSISRIENFPVSSQQPQLPSPPAKVWPRAHEVEPRDVGQSDEARTADSLPLIFLTNGKRASSLASATALHLRLPDVDVQTWDRWIGYQFNENDRATLLDAWMKADLKNGSFKGRISDPAISGVAFKLYRAGNDKWEQQTPEIQIAFDYPPITNATKLESLLQPEMTVDVAIANDTDKPIEALANRTVRIRVKPGEVYELEVLLKFAPNAASKFAGIYQSFETVPGMRLLIEAASPELPNADECLLNTATDFLQPDSRLEVTFKGPDPANPRLTVFRNVYRVEFMRQVWYWNGRVQSIDGEKMNTFPPPKPSNRDNEWLEKVKTWEKPEFAERPDSDHLIVPATDVHDSKQGPACFFKYVEDLSTDPRAQYYRFGTRIYSRYEGAYENLKPNSSFDQNTQPAPKDGWNRYFVPSRATKLGLPKIKALFPLTESAFPQQKPGLLVVLDGSAYDQAGLAERLRVVIEEVSDPGKDPQALTKADMYPQGAPDALASKGQILESGSSESGAFELIGPIGHSFDDAAAVYPKFTSSSYIIRPKLRAFQKLDRSDAPVSVDPAWWFVKLRFSVAVDASLCAPGAASSVQSQWTSGSWMQFLPGFVENATGNIADFATAYLAVESDRELTVRYIAPADQQQKLLIPKTSAGPHFRMFMILTKGVFDITGRLDQETYVGVFEPNGDHWKPLPSLDPGFAAKIATGHDLRARFVELEWECAGGAQENSPCTDGAASIRSEQEFWDRLFGDAEELAKLFPATDYKFDRHRARIVRISPMIRERVKEVR